ncbi:hypothetical protein M406DRAFT_94350 [Cryphonectria parasitica EP155]|uniref:Gluconokinase n=1 Tax=Cryphonectria parasitica (strain ATCC 38755 / EP155) TaxID=660469 RepID=A0A9P4XYP4_CRYP1|nr:uncharacterized protein M406DRAFT_94350 [Cryphonectria parasitica EP155]KAF3763346.1 hypothetical protein M406DRAFT_94350 [Cryphonectria parasitica EP155]
MADKSKPTEERPRYVFFFTGPTACGKSTIAKYVADRLHLTFLEGDDFHPRANIEKMHRGEPLTDDDRKGWLFALRDHETYHPTGAGEDKKTLHLAITCSALKRQYRDVLRQGSAQSPNLRVRFVYLDAPEEVLMDRARRRKGHFAGENLVHSQFLSLERPGVEEEDVVLVNVDRPLEDGEKEAVERVREILEREDSG